MDIHKKNKKYLQKYYFSVYLSSFWIFMDSFLSNFFLSFFLHKSSLPLNLYAFIQSSLAKNSSQQTYWKKDFQTNRHLLKTHPRIPNSSGTTRHRQLAIRATLPSDWSIALLGDVFIFDCGTGDQFYYYGLDEGGKSMLVGG